MLVDPNALPYPTPKSDGAALFTKADVDQSVGNAVSSSADSELDKFSDINSQDDALTREKK